MTLKWNGLEWTGMEWGMEGDAKCLIRICKCQKQRRKTRRRRRRRRGTRMKNEIVHIAERIKKKQKDENSLL